MEMENNLIVIKQNHNQEDLTVLLKIKKWTYVQIALQFINTTCIFIFLLGIILTFLCAYNYVNIASCISCIFIGFLLWIISGFCGMKTAKKCVYLIFKLHMNIYEIKKLGLTCFRIIFLAFVLVGWLQAILFMHLIDYGINSLTNQIQNDENQGLIFPNYKIHFPKLHLANPPKNGKPK